MVRVLGYQRHKCQDLFSTLRPNRNNTKYVEVTISIGIDYERTDMSLPNLASDAFLYVDPVTGEAKSLFFVTQIGVTVRENGDWEAVFDQKKIDDETKGLDCYILDFGKSLPEVEEEYDFETDESEHEGFLQFDRGELNSLKSIDKHYNLAYKAGEAATYEKDRNHDS